MKVEKIEAADNYAMLQLESARGMANVIAAGLSKGELSKDTAIDLFGEVYVMMACAYDQRISLILALKMNPKPLENSKRKELSDFSFEVYRLTGENLIRR